MKHWLTGIVLSLATGGMSAPLKSEPFSLAVADNTIDTVVSEVILKKAYAMLGHDIVIKRLPPKRALTMANSGAHDGDVQRIFSVAETFPNLIRIEPAINYIDGTGFVRKESNIDVASWSDLSSYRVGIILGIRFAETNVPKKNAIRFHNYRELATALTTKYIDVGIYPLSNGIYQTLLIGAQNIVPIKQPLARFELYHYVHKKNERLVEGLQKIFNQFKNNGTLSKVRERVLEISFQRARDGLEPCFENYSCYSSVWNN